MNFDKHQQEIIKAINSGDVYDILSFVKYFGYVDTYKNEKTHIERLFNEHENGKTYPVYVTDGFPFEEHRHIEQRSARLSYSGCNLEISFNGMDYAYDLFCPDGIQIATSIDEIKNFISLWEYLKGELELIEIEKDCSSDEIGLFFQKAPNPEFLKKYASSGDTKLIPIDISKFTISKHSVPIEEITTETVNAKNFIESTLICNYENLLICGKYLNKKIIPTPALRNFIAHNYQTPDQISTKKSLRLAWIAILVSLFTTIFSIYATFCIDPSENNLQFIQKQLNDISEMASTSYDDQLNELIAILESMENYDDKEIQEKLDDLIKKLNQINESTNESQN